MPCGAKCVDDEYSVVLRYLHDFDHVEAIQERKLFPDHRSIDGFGFCRYHCLVPDDFGGYVSECGHAEAICSKLVPTDFEWTVMVSGPIWWKPVVDLSSGLFPGSFGHDFGLYGSTNHRGHRQ